jgi:DNA-binding transcriptional MerR regulator
MFTPKQIADSLDLSSTAIRNYTRIWSAYLSAAANPEPGQPRIYSEDDAAVLATIAALRSKNANPDQIRAALDAGQRLEPVRPVKEPPPADRAEHDQQTAAAQQARAAVEATAATAEKAIAIYRDRVTAVEARNEDLTDRLIEAEKRAAAAEKELEVMRQLYEAATSTAAPGSTRPTFWQWLTGRK